MFLYFVLWFLKMTFLKDTFVALNFVRHWQYYSWSYFTLYLIRERNWGPIGGPQIVIVYGRVEVRHFTVSGLVVVKVLSRVVISLAFHQSQESWVLSGDSMWHVLSSCVLTCSITHFRRSETGLRGYWWWSPTHHALAKCQVHYI